MQVMIEFNTRGGEIGDNRYPLVTIDVTDIINRDINNNVIDLDFCELCQATSRRLKADSN